MNWPIEDWAIPLDNPDERCDIGEYFDGYFCLKCDSTCLSCDTFSKCTSCESYRTILVDGSCVPCDPDNFVLTGLIDPLYT